VVLVWRVVLVLFGWQWGVEVLMTALAYIKQQCIEIARAAMTAVFPARSGGCARSDGYHINR
jgi:hypothetical protein